MADILAPDVLDARQAKALEALLSEQTIAKAAAFAEVPQRTLYNWLRDDVAFIEAYRTARREAVQQAIARLQQGSSAAVDVLLTIMRNAKTPPATRLAAATKVLEMAHKGIELDDIDARLRALEEAGNAP